MRRAKLSRRRRSRGWRTRRLRKQRGGAGHTVDMVIAQYKESLGWLDEFKDRPFRKVYIYSKSPKPSSCPTWLAERCSFEELPNVGVCDHTYVHHIIKNYNSLADVTLFTPGSASLPYKLKKLQQMIPMLFEKPRNIFYGFVHGAPILNTKLAEFTISDWRVSDPQNQDTEFYPNEPASVRPFGEWVKHYITKESSPIESNGGVFAATRESIRSRPLEFYKKILDELDDARFEEASHFMERAWAQILQAKLDDLITQ
jgi:hypothetical protein